MMTLAHLRHTQQAGIPQMGHSSSFPGTPCRKASGAGKLGMPEWQVLECSTRHNG
jgi:hypothetical protein